MDEVVGHSKINEHFDLSSYDMSLHWERAARGVGGHEL